MGGWLKPFFFGKMEWLKPFFFCCWGESAEEYTKYQAGETEDILGLVLVMS